MRLRKGMIMPKRNVFYSFHYDNDVFRVQQIRNMGIISGNEPVKPNDWEEIKRNGNLSIQKWIDNEISKSSCVVVLIGTNTYLRPWVKYEILQAWAQGKGLLGVYIHNLKDPRTESTSPQGYNPFSLITVSHRGFQTNLSQLVRCYNPQPNNAYNDIYFNLESLVEDAIAYRYRLSRGRL